MEGPLGWRSISLVIAITITLTALSSASVVRGDDRSATEVALVLAFDLSASVNDAEYELQRAGTAAALLDPDVKAAILDAPGGIAVVAVQWASIEYQRIAIPWTILRTEVDIITYANRMRIMPRRLPGGGTSISGGLRFAATMFGDVPVIARRYVIDIAANGRADRFDDMRAVRAEIIKADIVINALAIEELREDLTRYFKDFLIGGEGAFVQTASSFDDIQQAMRAKLLREIGAQRLSDARPDPGLTNSDASG